MKEKENVLKGSQCVGDVAQRKEGSDRYFMTLFANLFSLAQSTDKGGEVWLAHVDHAVYISACTQTDIEGEGLTPFLVSELLRDVFIVCCHLVVHRHSPSSSNCLIPHSSSAVIPNY